MNRIDTIARTTLLKIIVAGMQLCWLYALISLLNDQLTARSWSFKVLFSAYPIAIGLYAGLMLFVRSNRLQELMAAISLCLYPAIAFKFAMPAEVPVSFKQSLMEFLYAPQQILFQYMPYLMLGGFALVQWGLGRRLVRTPYDVALLLVEFQLGFGCLLVALTLEYFLASQMALMNVCIILFFIFSLSGIALARFNKQTLHQNHALLPDRLIYIGLSAVAIAVLTVLVLVVINPQIIEVFVNLARNTQQWLTALTKYLMGLLPEQEWHTWQPDGGGCGPGGGSHTPSKPVDTNAYAVGHLIYQSIWIGFFVLVLWRFSNSVFDFLKKRYSTPSHVTRRHLDGAFKTDLRALLSVLWSLLLRPVGMIARLLSRLLPQWTRSWKSVSIGYVYRDILRWSSSGGFERAFHQTPHEHASWVTRRQPQIGKRLLFITRLFANDYYGSHPPSAEDQHRLLDEWRQLKKIKLKKKGNGKKNLWLFNQMWMFQRLRRPRQRLLLTLPRSLSVKKSPSS